MNYINANNMSKQTLQFYDETSPPKSGHTSTPNAACREMSYMLLLSRESIISAHFLPNFSHFGIFLAAPSPVLLGFSSSVAGLFPELSPFSSV